MDIKNLVKIGLDVNEAKDYLTLINFGPSMAGKIGERSKIHRTTVYEIIERLIKKGLVSYSISSNKKLFKANSPKLLKDQINEKKELVDLIVPDLINKYQKSNDSEESTIYVGKKGIKSILCEILKYNSYVSFGSTGEFADIMKHDFLLFQKQKKDAK